MIGETLSGAYRRGYKNGRKAGMLEVGHWLREAGLNIDKPLESRLKK